MNETCETVTISTENGPVIINAADFDAAIHTLADEAPPVPAPAPAPDASAAIYGVIKKGKTFHVVNGMTGAPVPAGTFAADGYASEAEAWAAINAPA